ncbi:MAG: FliM/FliN family flagellar motor switch protein [Gammaproteobacteria bacterium]|nr:FliM/FliN family flagellar motor switch protein [Gammaproteobacteria bacterium]
MSRPEEEIAEAPEVEDSRLNEAGDPEATEDTIGEQETSVPDEAAGVTAVVDKNTVIAYDFAHPSHKLNSRLPVLEVINEKIAKSMSTFLSAQFHQQIEVTAVEPTFEKFQDYVAALPPSVSINQFRMDPLQGSCILILDGDLIFMLVDSFFGGVDLLTESKGQRRFTPTELRITERVRDNIFKAMMTAWEPVIRIQTRFQGLLSKSEIASPAHPSVVVVCSRFEVEMKAGKRECHLLIPYSVLEPVRPQLTSDLKKMCDQDYEWLQEFSQQILGCDLELEGVFAESQISVKQLMNLKVGDFIPLGKVQTVKFSSEGIPLFEAAVGVSNGMVSASVTKWCERRKKRKK